MVVVVVVGVLVAGVVVVVIVVVVVVGGKGNTSCPMLLGGCDEVWCRTVALSKVMEALRPVRRRCCFIPACNLLYL